MRDQVPPITPRFSNRTDLQPWNDGIPRGGNSVVEVKNISVVKKRERGRMHVQIEWHGGNVKAMKQPWWMSASFNGMSARLPSLRRQLWLILSPDS